MEQMWLQANDDELPSASRAEYYSPHSQIKGMVTDIRGRNYNKKEEHAEDGGVIISVLKSRLCFSLFCLLDCTEQRTGEGN